MFTAVDKTLCNTVDLTTSQRTLADLSAISDEKISVFLVISLSENSTSKMYIYNID